MTKLPLETTCAIYEVAEELDLPLFLFDLETTYYTHQLPDHLKDPAVRERFKAQHGDVIKLERKDLPKIAPDIIHGIVISADHEYLKKAKSELEKIPHLDLSSSNQNNIELIPENVTKATAIRQLQEATGIPYENTLAFGDGMNDVEMFGQVKFSVAMANASEEVKQYASYETLSNAEHGISHFLKEFYSKENE